MIKQVRVTYEIECYNDFNDYPVAIADICEFSFDKLVSDLNLYVRNFSIIVISKITEDDYYINIEPMFVIYDKRIWKIHYSLRKFWINLMDISFKTECSCYHHSLSYRGKLKKIPCSDNIQIMQKYNNIARRLKSKNY